MGPRLSLYLVLILATPCFGANEDFTTFTETDPDSKLTVTSSRVTSTLANSRTETYSVYKDYGAGHFGNFSHLLTVFASAMNNAGSSPVLGYALISNQTGDIAGAEANGDGLSVHMFTGNYNLTMEEQDAFNSDFYDADTLIVYYLTIGRASTTATVLIYSDSGRTTLLDTLSIAMSSTTFRYISTAAGYDSGGAATVSGYAEDLNLQEATPNPSVIQGAVMQGSVLR